jgi:hypothetical protein
MLSRYCSVHSYRNIPSVTSRLQQGYYMLYCHVQYFSNLEVRGVAVCAQHFNVAMKLCLRHSSQGSAATSQCNIAVATVGSLGCVLQ